MKGYWTPLIAFASTPLAYGLFVGLQGLFNVNLEESEIFWSTILICLISTLIFLGYLAPRLFAVTGLAFVAPAFIWATVYIIRYIGRGGVVDGGTPFLHGFLIFIVSPVVIGVAGLGAWIKTKIAKKGK